MALVGDAIQKFRAEAPDLPQVMGSPSIPVLTGTSVTGGNLNPATTIFCYVTAVNQWGESLAPVVEGTGTPGGGNNALTVTSNAPPGATGGRAYWSPTVGAENQWVPMTLNSATGVLTGTIKGIGDTANTAGTPPVRNSAFLPDTDGDEISATLAFLWLNDALTLLSRKAGGLLDTTGINAVAQQQYYNITGRWQRFVSYWFLGWEIKAATRADMMYRYNISGIPEIVAQEIRANQTVISWNPQPNQAGNITTLTAPMAATDVELECVNAAPFQDLGRIQVDNEIMMFSQVDSTGTDILGLIRGVGGTAPAAHLNGATVTELGLWLTGFRYPTIYVPGNSNYQLDAAPAWEVPLHKYLIARYLKHCQLDQEAAAMMKEFDQDAKELETENPGVVRAMQVGPPSSWFDRGLSHRLIVP